MRTLKTPLFAHPKGAFYMSFRTDFLAEVDLAGPEMDRLLTEAENTLTEIHIMEQRIAADGVMLGKQAHPLLKELRAHRAAFTAIIKVLSPSEASRAGAGTDAGRALASARWKRSA
jgi:hypothetical protein